MSRKSVLSGVAAAAAASLVLAACGGGGNTAAGDGTVDPEDITGNITFTFWGNDDRADRYQQAIDLFEEQYPGTSVSPNFTAFPDYWPARNTEAAGRALPDVMQFDSSFLREYGESNLLLDLAPYADSGAIDLSNYDDTITAGGLLGDAQVGIPTSTNTLGMFVNPDVLAEAGVEFPEEGYTYEDYNEFLQAVYDADATTADGQRIYGAADYTGTFWFFLQYLVQNGEEPFTEDGQLNFGEDEVREFLELTADLREQDAVFPTSRTVALQPLGGFTASEAATEASWDNFLAGYAADSGNDNIEIMPIWSTDQGTGNFFRPSMLLSAGANTENPATAVAFINFLLTEPEVGRIFGTSRGVPADTEQRAAVDAPEGSVDAKVLAYQEEVGATQTTVAPVPVRGFGSIEESWRTLSEELNYGNVTVDEFISEWFAEVDNVIM